jgi:hypothetical protein
MYSKQEEATLRKQFWTAFGQYLSPIPSSEGNKINWINYKTGVKFISFRMDAFKDHAYIGIEISHTSKEAQEKCFNQFRLLKKDMEAILAEKWEWELSAEKQGKHISRIYQILNGVNIYRQSDWPAIISFLKTGITALDRFWNLNKDIFEMMN